MAIMTLKAIVYLAFSRKSTSIYILFLQQQETREKCESLPHLHSYGPFDKLLSMLACRMYNDQSRKLSYNVGFEQWVCNLKIRHMLRANACIKRSSGILKSFI